MRHLAFAGSPKTSTWWINIPPSLKEDAFLDSLLNVCVCVCVSGITIWNEKLIHTLRSDDSIRKEGVWGAANGSGCITPVGTSAHPIELG